MTIEETKDMIEGMQDRISTFADCATMAAKFGHERLVEKYVHRVALCSRGLKRLQLHLEGLKHENNAI